MYASLNTIVSINTMKHGGYFFMLQNKPYKILYSLKDIHKNLITLLNEAKISGEFKNIKIHPYFICLLACLYAAQGG